MLSVSFGYLSSAIAPPSSFAYFCIRYTAPAHTITSVTGIASQIPVYPIRSGRKRMRQPLMMTPLATEIPKVAPGFMMDWK